MEKASQEGDAFWLKVLTEGHRPLRVMHALFRYLPSSPRCKICHNPFGGIGGKLVGLFGFTPSRKNPNLCTACCERMPRGGAEVDIAILFADVRGSTALGEQLAPAAFAAVLNRFYDSATEVLVRHDAIIDKLIGDEVMALFIRGICGPDYHQRSVQAAAALMRTLGYGSAAGPTLKIGAAINSGLTYVGNVGSEVTDFTALGDTVNTAARMASSAAAGEILIDPLTYQTVAERLPDLAIRSLSLRGKDHPVEVRVLDSATAVASARTL